jgi:DNA polymerase I-like protein with 3'-5' exonuclease and polymerase domains
MNLLAMIETDRKFKERNIDGHILGTVHDATLFEIKIEDLGEALPLIKTTFQNLPLQKKFGVKLDVPIIADIKVGGWWGDAKEIPDEVVLNDEALRLWLRETDCGRKEG